MAGRPIKSHFSRIFAQNGGFSVIELLVALALLALLGGSIMTVIGAGSSAYDRMLSDRGALSEARIAMSYITVRLRQNDLAGAISIVESDSQTNTRNVLRVDKEPGDPSGYSHFILFEENVGGAGGRLVERVSDAPGVGQARAAGASARYRTNVIAEISDFAVFYRDGRQDIIDIKVAYNASGDERSLLTTIFIKSNQ